MRRMRTIPQAAAWAKETDPQTALTQTALRRLVLTGEIPHVAVGKKRLVALEDLESYLEQGHGQLPATVTGVGVIRPVEARI